ncbi:DNA polymerase III subunit delta [Porphyromonadaceae bacterium W3.11]|nr:DNA polymerase III subunit delta [Porphyromonadaceae bacterium W3.11]
MPYSDKPQNILQEIRPDRKPFPIYILMGVEEYFTDKIEKKILSTYMPNEEERDFNYTLLYGSGTSVEEIMTTCRRYPMGGNRTIVVVREAQALIRGGESGGGHSLEALTTLIDRPNPYNILVLCIKGGKTISRRSKYVKRLEEYGIIVNSPEIRDYQIEPYIQPLAQEHGLKLDFSAIQLVAERIGTDLTRMDNEFEKLETALSPQQRTLVTSDMILKYTSINKEYSVFDLRRALAEKNKAKAIQIAMSLSSDEKRAPVQMLLPQLFDYYANLLIAFYTPPPKTEQAVMKQLGIDRPFFVKEYIQGLRNYGAFKVTQIISYLRRCDARSKGMYGEDGSSEEILIDLVLFIFN